MPLAGVERGRRARAKAWGPRWCGHWAAQEAGFLANAVLIPHPWSWLRTSFTALTWQKNQLPSYLSAEANQGQSPGTSEFGESEEGLRLRPGRGLSALWPPVPASAAAKLLAPPGSDSRSGSTSHALGMLEPL